MDILEDGFHSPAFLAEYWRQRPCVVRAAKPTPDLDSARFLIAAERARQENPDRVKEGAGTVFVEGVDRFLPPLDGLLDPFRALARGLPLWCDALRMEGRGCGIGCHFDDSDNFSFQLEGSKRWRLHAPDIIPAERVRRRLLQERGAGVGGIHMPEDTCLEVVLEPGDAIYLPVLWPHWAESEGPSLSMTVAIIPTSLIQLIRRELAHAERDPAFYLPLKTGEDLSGAVSRCFLGLKAQARVEPPPPAPAEPSPIKGSIEPAELAWDLDRLRRLLAGLCQVPDPASTLMTQEGPGDLQRPFSGLMLKRLIIAVTRAHERQVSPAIRSHLALCARLVNQGSDLALEEWARRPDTTAWIWQMSRTLDFEFTPQVEAVATHLGNLALDLALQAGLGGPARGMHLVLVKSVLELPGAGLRLRFPLLGLQRAQVDLEGDRMQFRAEEGSLGWLEHGPGALRAGGGLDWEPLPRVPGTDIVLCHRSSMVQAFYPQRREERASKLLDAFPIGEVVRYQEALGEGIALLKQVWPEGAKDVCQFISVAVPLVDDQGLEPNNQSVHAFRGLMATSPRRSVSAAQILMHESGHNKFSTLLDLCPLVENEEPGPLLFSPFVGTERPWPALLHGLFSFARDLEATRRLMGVVPDLPGQPLELYFERHVRRWRSGLDTAEAGLRFTPQGARLMEAFRQFERTLPATRTTP